MKARKSLPPFKILKRKVDIPLLVSYLEDKGLLDFNLYNDIKLSSASNYKNFLKGNAYSKNTFFLEENANSLEGELYKQLYITKFKFDQTAIAETDSGVKTRLHRLIKNNSNYVPELDEHNYGAPTEHFHGVLKNILEQFKSPLTRVRLAVLMPNMTIKKHRDYDPSYICRYHIPIVTNNLIEFGMEVNKQLVTFNMIADGSIYFFNSGLPHWVTNRSNTPRLHLIVDTNGQLDLNE